METLDPLDIVQTIRNPLLILDGDLRVTFANRAFHRSFETTEEDTHGMLIYDLGDGQWNIARLRELLHEVIPRNSIVEDFEVETRFPKIGRRTMCLNARKIYRVGNHSMRLLLAFEDITDRVQRDRDKIEAAQEVYHRVKNSLSIVMGFVALETRRAEIGDARILQAIHGRVAAIAQLYDLISQSEIDAAVRADVYLTELAAQLSRSLLGEHSPIKVSARAEPLTISKDASVPIGLLVNELTTNAIKHAFPQGAGSVDIVLQRQGDEVRLAVTDDGIGMAAAAKTGFGTRYVNLFVRQLKGVLVQASNGNGTSFEIRLPLAVLAT